MMLRKRSGSSKLTTHTSTKIATLMNRSVANKLAMQATATRTTNLGVSKLISPAMSSLLSNDNLI